MAMYNQLELVDGTRFNLVDISKDGKYLVNIMIIDEDNLAVAKLSEPGNADTIKCYIVNGSGETLDTILTGYNTIKSYSMVSATDKVLGVLLEKTDSIDEKLEAVNTAMTAVENSVNTLSNEINPTYNVDAMTLEELIAYKKNVINKACESTIFNGIDVETSYGVEHFALSVEDQSNLKALFDTVAAAGTDCKLYYHADGKDCTMYTGSEIANIYFTSQVFITHNTTYCNQLKMMLDEMDIETIKTVEWGYELTEERTETLNAAIQAVQDVITSLTAKLV